MTHVCNDIGQVFRVHHLDTLLEDDLALVVHHVVELQKVLADVEIARFDLLLGFFQGLVDPRMDDRLVFFQPQLCQHAIHALGTENAHQIILQRQEEFGITRIALTARATAQLIVNAAAFVTLGSQNVKTTRLEGLFLQFGNFGGDLVPELFGFLLVFAFKLRLEAHIKIAAELNVGAATGHVGCDGDGTGDTGLSDDAGFLLMVAGVQYLEILDPGFLELLGQKFRLLDGGRTNQDGLFPLAAFLDQRNDGAVLLLDRSVDLIVLIDPLHGAVGRHFHDVQLVDVAKFRRFRHGRTGHAGQFFVHAEIVLEGDGGQRLVFRLDLDVFLGFQCLMLAL